MEEAPEDVVLRFESFILNEILKTRISVKDLTSTCNKEVSQDIIDKLENDLKPYLDFFNEHVEFSTSRNPTGVWNEVKRYCEEHGTVHKKKQMYLIITKKTTLMNMSLYSLTILVLYN